MTAKHFFLWNKGSVNQKLFSNLRTICQNKVAYKSAEGTDSFINITNYDFLLMLKLLKAYDMFYLRRLYLFLNSNNNAVVENHLYSASFPITIWSKLMVLWKPETKESKEECKLSVEHLTFLPSTI